MGGWVPVSQRGRRLVGLRAGDMAAAAVSHTVLHGYEGVKLAATRKLVVLVCQAAACTCQDDVVFATCPQLSETAKWSSNYTGVSTKFKGRAGARQYWAQLAADLDIKTYQVGRHSGMAPLCRCVRRFTVMAKGNGRHDIKTYQVGRRQSEHSTLTVLARLSRTKLAFPGRTHALTSALTPAHVPTSSPPSRWPSLWTTTATRPPWWWRWRAPAAATGSPSRPCSCTATQWRRRCVRRVEYKQKSRYKTFLAAQLSSGRGSRCERPESGRKYAGMPLVISANTVRLRRAACMRVAQWGRRCVRQSM